MIKKTNESTLKQAIEELLKSYHLDEKIKETRVINSWEKIVGRMIARHTISLYIKNGKLFVKLDSAALTNELTYAREKIVKALNKEAGEEILREIVFK